MPFSSDQGPTEPMGVVNNPLVKSLFVAGFEEGGFPIPPSSAYRITDAGDTRITDVPTANRITD